MSSETDKTNPKDLLGISKVPLGLVPAAGKIYAAMAMADGAKKYGPYNWRDKKVRLTIYLDAIERHLIAYRDGEDCALDSKLPHLAHIIACGCILADAIEGGFLVDDRPLPGPATKTLDKFNKGARVFNIPNEYKQLPVGATIEDGDFQRCSFGVEPVSKGCIGAVVPASHSNSFFRLEPTPGYTGSISGEIAPRKL